MGGVGGRLEICLSINTVFKWIFMCFVVDV